jgi:hypothetical protein
MTRSWPVAAAAALMFLALPPVSAAAETFGSSLSATADAFIACDHPSGCTVTQTALPARTVTAPRDGVLVRWRASFLDDVAAQDVSLVVLRRNGAEYGAVAASSAVSIGDGQGSLSEPTGLRVKAGDQIAIGLEDGGEIGAVARPTADASFAMFAPPLFGTASRGPDESGPVDTEILLNADIEPDLDDDGSGDQTQDSCPESPQRSTVPCTIDLNVTSPIRPSHLHVGSSAAVTVRIRWRLEPNLFQWLLPGATLTIEAPSHAAFIPSPVASPCTIVTAQRAVCPFEFQPIGGSGFVTAEVDERTAPRQLVRAGATFTASVSSSARDADPSNNSVSWNVPIDEPHCGQRLIGTRRANRIVGTEYSDIIEGRNGSDTLIGKGGRDCIEGGLGNDRLLANDGERDAVLCGLGRRDRAVVDRLDRPRGCEVVKRKRAPS